MVNLILASGDWITSNGLWGKLIGMFYNWIHNFGWTIVVFTICLKLILIPLDIYQKHISSVSSEKQAEMQPELDQINRIYSSSPEMKNKMTMQLYKKHNYNMGATCFGLLINLVITLVIFLTLFSSLRAISKSMIVEQYSVLRTTYIETYNSFQGSEEFHSKYNEYRIEYNTSDDVDKSVYTSADNYASYMINEYAENYAQKAVAEKYNEIKESWLWIKNIYLTDTNTSPFPSFNQYVSNSGTTFKNGYLSLEDEINLSKSNSMEYANDYIEKDETKAKELAQADYEEITGFILEDVKGKWNGYFILIILAGAVTWLSTKVATLGQKKQTQKIKLPDGSTIEQEINPMKTMNLILPILMIFFTWSYTGLFALYIVTNSVVSVLISLSTYGVKKYIITPKKQLASNESVISWQDMPTDNYRMYDKYTVIEDSEKKNNKEGK